MDDKDISKMIEFKLSDNEDELDDYLEDKFKRLTWNSNLIQNIKIREFNGLKKFQKIGKLIKWNFYCYFITFKIK